jgi:hypothetical protein
MRVRLLSGRVRVAVCLHVCVRVCVRQWATACARGTVCLRTRAALPLRLRACVCGCVYGGVFDGVLMFARVCVHACLLCARMSVCSSSSHPIAPSRARVCARVCVCV